MRDSDRHPYKEVIFRKVYDLFCVYAVLASTCRLAPQMSRKLRLADILPQITRIDTDA